MFSRKRMGGFRVDCKVPSSTMDLATLLTPRAEGFLEALRDIHSKRPDLQEAFPDPLEGGMAHWMGVNGVREYPEALSSYYPPIPPEHLRHTACGGLSEHSHLYTSAEDFRVVCELYEVYTGRPVASIESVYDFGCGCGRLLRWFPIGIEGVRCVGSDVRAASIEWCQKNLSGHFFTNDVQPPLELETDSLDLVVSLSTFSHFNRKSNEAWIRELARVCKPDGLILATTHGAFALALILRSAEHQRGLYMEAEKAVDYMRRLAPERFLFHAVPEELVEKLDGPEPEYGQAFFNEAFVEHEWGGIVELLGAVPVGLNLFQDFYALRPAR